MEKETQRLTIKQLATRKNLFLKVVAMLNADRTYKYIRTFMNTQGFDMSDPTLSSLKHKVKDNLAKGIPPMHMLEEMSKSNTKSIKKKDVNDKIIGHKPNQVEVRKRVNDPREIMEELLNKGFNSLQNIDYLDLDNIIKVTDLYQKYYGKEEITLTSNAINQYKILVNSTIAAMQEVLMKYVPRESQEEALEALEEARAKKIRNLTSTSDGRALLKALDENDLSY